MEGYGGMVAAASAVGVPMRLGVCVRAGDFGKEGGKSPLLGPRAPSPFSVFSPVAL